MPRLGTVPHPRLEGSDGNATADEAAVAADWFPAVAAELGAAPALDGIDRAVARFNPLAVAPASGRLLVRAAIRLRAVCSVRNQGRYDPMLLDRGSPLWRGLLGIDRLRW